MMSIADQQQKLERLQLGGSKQQGGASGDKASSSSCVTYHQFVVGALLPPCEAWYAVPCVGCSALRSWSTTPTQHCLCCTQYLMHSPSSPFNAPSLLCC